MTNADLADVLDAAVDIVVNDGFESVSLGMLAGRSGLERDRVLELVGSVEHALLLMLERERTEISKIVLDNVERDPLGGLLSRIYYYTLSAIYERPVHRALYLTDPESLQRMIRTLDSFELTPSIAVRMDFIQRLIEVGMVRPGTDAGLLSGMLSTFSAGLALTSPREDYDLVVKAIELVLVTMFDASPRDTSAGKNAFRTYVTTAPSMADPDFGDSGFGDSGF
jgi:AcrR family transcriptional regulator